MFQAHGARQIRSMQAALQRGMMVLTIACGCLSVVLFNGERILLLAKQDPELAQIGGTIMKWTCIAIWPMTMFDIVKRYFQAMSRLRPALVTTLFALVVTMLSNFVLVFVKGYGVNGVGASLFLGNMAMFLTIFAYYCYSEVPDSWWQLSDEAFERWQNFLSLAFPSLVMMFFEWGSFEVGLLIISYLGPETIATQTILMNAAYLLFTIPAGVSTAAVTRVGNHLGAGDGKAAAIASTVCGVLAGLSGIVAAALLTLTRNYWPYIYTNDESLLAAVIEVSPWLAIFELTDNIQTTLGAAVKGTGRPHLGAILTAIGFWVISVPLGSYISITRETVAGIWQGFLYGEIVLISSYIYALYVTDWPLMVEKAQRLVLSDAKSGDPLLKRKNSIPPSPIPETIFV
uniref:MATE efflux family protein n=1 Tax=Rhodosorus marinus TaxID=101924 RepID=A0A7S2ZMX7_9RHOD|mmetsp:Transcript_2547/g.11217  ORF Transcript_2547/g.11217 Transcript_2547/m.11217 type:complete len:401 (+) Transcript_2547:533-1735(+)